MPTLQLTLTLELDGQPLPDLTVIRRLVVDNALPFARQQVSQDIPAPFLDVIQLARLQALMLRATDKPLTFIIAAAAPLATPTPIEINPGGCLLLFDVDVSQSGDDLQPLLLLQDSGDASGIVGVAGGSSK